MFVSPGEPRKKQIMVIQDFAVSRPFPRKEKLDFMVRYTPLGFIDSARARFSPLPRTLEVRGGVTAVNVQGSGPGESWRLEGPVPPPYVTVDAAIRYVARLRANSTEPAIRENAAKTLAALKRLYQQSSK